MKYKLGEKLTINRNSDTGIVLDRYESPTSGEIIYELDTDGGYPLIREDDIPEQEGDAPLE